MRRRIVQAMLSAAALLALLLGGCGFQLRGPRPMPFDSLHVAMPEASELGAALKRNIRAASPAMIPPKSLGEVPGS